MGHSDNPELSSDTDYKSSQTSDFERYLEEPRPAALDNKKQYTCDTCNQEFFRRGDYDRHIFKHTGIKTYACTENGCDKKYSIQSHLNRHVKTAHKSLKFENQNAVDNFIECNHSTCTKLFKTKATMLSHFRENHGSHKFFECPKCPEKFKRKMQLRRHSYKHTQQYPHKCEICEKGFSDMKSFLRHKNIHGERQSKTCDICAKDFGKWSDLVAHNKLEHVSQHKCEQCDKVFYSKANLRQHQQIHLPKLERTVYECPHEKCPKFYFDNKNLQAHIRSKHEGKKFVCSHAECKRELTTKQKLDQHLKMHISANRNSPKSATSSPASRKQRKDAGIPRIPAASLLTNIVVEDPIVEKLIIDGHGKELRLSPKLFETTDEKSEESDAKM